MNLIGLRKFPFCFLIRTFLLSQPSYTYIDVDIHPLFHRDFSSLFFEHAATREYSVRPLKPRQLTDNCRLLEIANSLAYAASAKRLRQKYCFVLSSQIEMELNLCDAE